MSNLSKLHASWKIVVVNIAIELKAQWVSFVFSVEKSSGPKVSRIWLGGITRNSRPRGHNRYILMNFWGIASINKMFLTHLQESKLVGEKSRFAILNTLFKHIANAMLNCNLGNDVPVAMWSFKQVLQYDTMYIWVSIPQCLILMWGGVALYTTRLLYYLSLYYSITRILYYSVTPLLYCSIALLLYYPITLLTFNYYFTMLLLCYYVTMILTLLL